jgi:hypothetical protein
MVVDGVENAGSMMAIMTLLRPTAWTALDVDATGSIAATILPMQACRARVRSINPVAVAEDGDFDFWKSSRRDDTTHQNMCAHDQATLWRRAEVSLQGRYAAFDVRERPSLVNDWQRLLHHRQGRQGPRSIRQLQPVLLTASLPRRRSRASLPSNVTLV